MDEYRRMSVAEAIILSDTTGEIGDKNISKKSAWIQKDDS